MFLLPALVVAGFAAWIVGQMFWEESLLTAVLAAAGTLVVGVFAALILIVQLPYAFEWLLVHLRACPDCGRRSWSWPFTRGFGL